MTQPGRTRLAEIVVRHEKDILDDWLKLQAAALTRRRDLITDQDLRATRPPSWPPCARPPRRTPTCAARPGTRCATCWPSSRGAAPAWA